MRRASYSPLSTSIDDHFFRKVSYDCLQLTSNGDTIAETAQPSANAIDDKCETKNSFDKKDFDTLCQSGKASTSSDPQVCVDGSPSESNFQGHHLHTGSLLQSSDPLLNINDATTATDFDFLGQEVMAAASTASAMLSRYDGFDPMQAFSGSRELIDCAASALTNVPIDELGVNQFSQYPYQYSTGMKTTPVGSPICSPLGNISANFFRSLSLDFHQKKTMWIWDGTENDPVLYYLPAKTMVAIPPMPPLPPPSTSVTQVRKKSLYLLLHTSQFLYRYILSHNTFSS